MRLVVNPLFNDWQEGTGLDLEGYKDNTRGNEGSNWMIRANTPGVAEIRTFTFSSDTKADYGAGSGANYIKLYNGSGADATARFNVWFNDGTGDSAPVADGTEVEVDASTSVLSATGALSRVPSLNHTLNLAVAFSILLPIVVCSGASIYMMKK